MKRLFLLRHARAAPAGGTDADFDRALILSGIEDATAMAAYIRKQDYRIDLVLCSPAARAAQTAALVAREIAAPVAYRDNLYLAPLPRLVAAVRGAPPAVTNLMIVGHNPGLEECAAALSQTPLRRSLSHQDKNWPSKNWPSKNWHGAVDERFPTAALAILDFDAGRWRDVREGAGHLIAFTGPSDL